MMKTKTGMVPICLFLLSFTATSANASLLSHPNSLATDDNGNLNTWPAIPDLNGKWNWKELMSWVSKLEKGGMYARERSGKNVVQNLLHNLDLSNLFSQLREEHSGYSEYALAYVKIRKMHHHERLGMSVMEPLATPVPAAAWLFGSGLLALLGLAKRRRQ